MLTPREIKKAPYVIEALFEALEDEVIKSFALNLKRQGEANDMDLYRLETLAIYQRELEAKVESAIKEAQKETDSIIKESAIKSYLDDAKRYKKVGKSLLAYEANEKVQALVGRIRKQTEGEYKDLSRGLGLINPITKQIHPLAQYYKNELDKAIFSAHLGVFSYQEMSKKAIDSFSEQGISWFNFETGTRRSLTAHVHTVIRTSLGQLSNQMTEINLEDMGECYVEVSAHGGARPSHATWQGKQFYWKDKDTGKDNNKAGYPEFISATGYGTGEGLGGYNCRHTYYPFFPNRSTPAYTDKELKALAGEAREYQGKEYTVYDANQKLRAYERAIRKSKRKLVGYEALGDDEAFLYESVKLRLTTDEYRAFAKGVDLPTKVARTQEVGYNKGILKISGAITDVYSERAEAHASVQYGAIRKRKTDVERIAKNTGYSEAEVQSIKNYLFLDYHEWNDNKRFTPDFSIAQSWTRLFNGNFEPHDLTLLNHELYEQELIKKGLTQREAHIITSEIYNYQKEADEYYDLLKKRQKRKR